MTVELPAKHWAQSRTSALLFAACLSPPRRLAVLADDFGEHAGRLVKPCSAAARGATCAQIHGLKLPRFRTGSSAWCRANGASQRALTNSAAASQAGTTLAGACTLPGSLSLPSRDAHQHWRGGKVALAWRSGADWPAPGRRRNPEMKTPNLDTLAAQGIKLDRHCALRRPRPPAQPLAGAARRAAGRSPRGSASCALQTFSSTARRRAHRCSRAVRAARPPPNPAPLPHIPPARPAHGTPRPTAAPRKVSPGAMSSFFFFFVTKPRECVASAPYMHLQAIRCT